MAGPRLHDHTPAHTPIDKVDKLDNVDTQRGRNASGTSTIRAMAFAKHHYVPAFLGRQWHSPSDQQLTRYMRVRGKLVTRRLGAGVVFREPHLYSRNRSSPAPDVSTEQHYLGPQIDDPAAKVHQHMLVHGVPTVRSQLIAWSLFLTSMLVRRPDRIAYIRARSRQLLSDELARAVPPSELPEKELDDMGIDALPDLVQSEKLNDAICSGIWSVRALDPGCSTLLLGDCGMVQAGPLNESFMVALPLGPRCVFLATSNDFSVDQLRRIDDATLVDQVNTATAMQSTKYVCDVDERNRPLVEQHLRLLPADP